MRAVSEAFREVPDREGRVIGILPGVPAPPGYPSDAVEIVIRTHLSRRGEDGEHPESRNAINVLSSDAIIALPGGAGTASETRLAHHFRRPVIAFVEERADIPGLPGEIPIARTLSAVREFLENHLPGVFESPPPA